MIKRFHGGSQNKNLTDFSAPSNPLGAPKIAKKILENCIKNRSYERYPSYNKLRNYLSNYFNINKDFIIPINGSDEALSLIPILFRPKNLIIIEPNFGDHEILSNAIRSKLIRITLDIENKNYIDTEKIIKIIKSLKGSSLLIFSRPNNPIGFCLKINDINEIIDNLDKDVNIIIDEAFIEISDCDPLKPSEEYILLRSQTKTFSTPGFRLGEIISLNYKFIEKIESSIQAWPIDAITNCFYSKILKNKEFIKNYIDNANKTIKKERQFIENSLNKELKVYNSRTAFLLIKHEIMPNPLFKKELIKKGIYIRDASTFYGLNKNYSRISIRLHGDNIKLIDAINGVLNEKDKKVP
ncbi:MAG: aminotransferase class I/II-fold pyridoxal phosphate-dependent enzyme [Caldisphaera sp.]|jgi:histidinol-phosphate/aromatic aminotransferase/cobyric acid decarboxylase-like protein